MKSTVILSFLGSCLVSSYAIATDGLSDLKNALKRLDGNSPIIVELNSSFADAHDEELKNGKVTVVLNDNSRGFQLTYSSEELAKMQAEKVAKIDDEDAPSPTLDAAYKLKAINLHKVLTASTNLSQFLEKAEFLSEKKSVFNNENVRVLAFDLPMEVLIYNKRTRKYVDDFSARYEILIRNDGTPIKSELNFQGSGSAYMVLSVEAYGSNIEYYQVVDDRLVVTKSATTNGSKSFFGDFERNEEKVIVIMKG